VRWYRVAGAELKTITASTCPNYGGGSATFDTRISVFLVDGSCVGGNDDEDVNCGQKFRSKFTWTSAACMDYYIMVHAWGLENGDFDLSVSSSEAPIK
jgi:hypothetical protein